MRIDASNCEIINSKEVYVHDCLFKGFQLDWDKKELIVTLVGTPYAFGQGKEVTIRFCDVLGLDMTMCDFFGGSHCLNGWNNIESGRRKLLPWLFQQREEFLARVEVDGKSWREALKEDPKKARASFLGGCRLTDDESYIESVFEFISADELTIVCRYIVMET